MNLKKVKVKVQLCRCVQLFATPWIVAHQAPVSMEFCSQEYWSALPFPSPGIEPRSPELAGGLFITAHLGSPLAGRP